MDTFWAKVNSKTGQRKSLFLSTGKNVPTSSIHLRVSVNIWVYFTDFFKWTKRSFHSFSTTKPGFFFVHFTKNSGPKKLRFLRKNSGVFEKTLVFLSKNPDFRDFLIFLLNKLLKTQLKTKKKLRSNRQKLRFPRILNFKKFQKVYKKACLYTL